MCRNLAPCHTVFETLLNIPQKQRVSDIPRPLQENHGNSVAAHDHGPNLHQRNVLNVNRLSSQKQSPTSIQPSPPLFKEDTPTARSQTHSNPWIYPKESYEEGRDTFQSTASVLGIYVLVSSSK